MRISKKNRDELLTIAAKCLKEVFTKIDIKEMEKNINLAVKNKTKN